jgi:hypothetical protein
MLSTVINKTRNPSYFCMLNTYLKVDFRKYEKMSEPRNHQDSGIFLGFAKFLLITHKVHIFHPWLH